MALRTFNSDVLPFQRVAGLGMLDQPELRRFPAVNQVTRRALTAIGPTGELRSMRVGTMAVGTLCERDWFLEISARVALRTRHGGVFSAERELRFAVIELFTEDRSRNRSPCACVVTGLTSRGKCAAVRILMAIGASFECKPFPFWLGFETTCHVALLTRYVHMGAGQLKTRLRVIELGCRRLPIGCVVTPLAILAKLPPMFIRVARHATRRQAQVRAVQILHANRRSLTRGDVRRVMTFVAGDSAVFPIKSPASFRMIKLGLRGLPSNKVELESVML